MREQKDGASGALPTRALLLGLLLVITLAGLSIRSNLFFQRYITAASLPSGAIFVLAVTIALNAVVRRRWPERALSPRELAIVFAMLYVSAALPQAAVGETIVTLAVAARYFSRFARAGGERDSRSPARARRSRGALVLRGAARPGDPALERVGDARKPAPALTA